MGEQIVEKVIGAEYVMYNNEFFAADIYEGNYYKVLEGNKVLPISLRKEDYERVVARYEECVKKDIKFETAYETNQRAHLRFSVPTITADPEAADKEWYIRKHPHVVLKVEQPKKKKGLFGKKKKVSIKCLECGTVNNDKQKFCGECGAKLPSAEEEIIENGAVIETANDTAAQAVMAKEPEKKAAVQESPVKKETADVKQEPVKKTEEPVKKAAVKEDKKQESAEEDFMNSQKKETKPIKKEEPAEEIPVKQVNEEKPSEKMDEDIEIINITEDEKTESGNDSEDTKDTKGKKNKKEKKDKKNKKRRWPLIIILSLAVLLLGGGAAFLYFNPDAKEVVFDSLHIEQNAQQPSQAVVEEEKEPVKEITDNKTYVVIKLKNDIAMNGQIREEDIEGKMISEEQYIKYSDSTTYIDKNGQVKEQELLLWDDKDSVIGKYATRDLSNGSILFDTAITSEHVVADKTFVDVEVDGEGNTIEVESNVLPGNTRIQIVAVIQTDGAAPQQVLLSEMTLQDRSLESIFNSAGQDILEMLSTENEGAENSEQQETEDSAEAEQQ